ncbi:hypothetical protein HDU99_008234, partial [Rhizoclosmatium hyalinum]
MSKATTKLAGLEAQLASLRRSEIAADVEAEVQVEAEISQLRARIESAASVQKALTKLSVETKRATLAETDAAVQERLLRRIEDGKDLAHSIGAVDLDDSDVSMVGVSIAFLERLVEEWGGVLTLNALATVDVVNKFIKPVTQATRLSYCDQLFLQEPSTLDVAPAQWF